MLAPYKFILICTASFLFACDNSSNSSEQKVEPAKKSATLPADSMSTDALFSFVDGCVTNAKLTLGEEKAFAFCKCIYDQLRKENPDVDSVRLNNLVNDTAQVAKLASNCR